MHLTNVAMFTVLLAALTMTADVTTMKEKPRGNPFHVITWKLSFLKFKHLGQVSYPSSPNGEVNNRMSFIFYVHH